MNPANFSAAVKGAVKSLTIWVAAIFALVGNVAPYITPTTLEGMGIKPTAAQVVCNIVAFVMIVLRVMTTKSLADKGNGSGPSSTPPASVYLLFAMAPILLALSACATTAATAPQTFEQVVSTTIQANDVALKLIGSLAASHVLSSTDATTAVGITDKVQAALTLAQASFTAGDQATASAKIAAATAALAQVQLCFAPNSKVSTTLCLAGVTTP